MWRGFEGAWRRSEPAGRAAHDAVASDSFHGKEGVAGSSPAEGSRESPAQAGFLGRSGLGSGEMSRPGFDGGLEARMMSWREEILASYGQTEEVPG
jgi:hypothetical protein